MSTGLENWSNPETIGAIYPFVGSEMLMFILLLASWLLWHMICLVIENNEWKEDISVLAGQPLPGEEYGDN
ncbi:MAG: hypothetical protein R3E62_06715 [Pseudomonadales bacterium]|jgi:hypothetical protein